MLRDPSHTQLINSVVNKSIPFLNRHITNRQYHLKQVFFPKKTFRWPIGKWKDAFNITNYQEL